MAVALIPLNSHRFHVGTAVEIRFIYLNDVHVFKAVGGDGIAQFGIEDSVGAQTAILG